MVGHRVETEVGVDEAETIQSGQVGFQFIAIPGSFLFELAIRFDDRLEWIGGSRALMEPEDALMRAALVLIGGSWEAQARMPAENDDHTLSFRAFLAGDPPNAAWVGERACELIWSEVDRRNGGVIEQRSLGFAGSVVQLAEAALEAGEARRAAISQPPSAALIALSAALPALKAQAPRH